MCSKYTETHIYYHSIFVTASPFWYLQESIESNALKPSLGMYDTHRFWAWSQRESSGKIFKAKSAIFPSLHMCHGKLLISVTVRNGILSLLVRFLLFWKDWENPTWESFPCILYFYCEVVGEMPTLKKNQSIWRFATKGFYYYARKYSNC